MARNRKRARSASSSRRTSNRVKKRLTSAARSIRRRRKATNKKGKYVGTVANNKVKLNPSRPISGQRSGWDFMPKSVTTTLYYTEQLNNATVVSSAYQAFKMSVNSLYDPNFTHLTTGHQPRGYDQYMTYYGHYQVISSTCKFTYNGPLTGTARLEPFRAVAGIGIGDIMLGAISDAPSLEYPLHVALDERGMGSKLIVPAFSNGSYPRGGRSLIGPSFTLKWSLKKAKRDLLKRNPAAVDILDARHWQATEFDSPSQPAAENFFFELFTFPNKFDGEIDANDWKIEVAYKVRFSDRKPMGQS